MRPGCPGALSPAQEGRRRLEPPGGASEMPQVVCFQEEIALLDALRSGVVDAIARRMLGNADADTESAGEFAVGARHSHREIGASRWRLRIMSSLCATARASNI
ncbi:MAG: hypothetical protein OXQ29_25290 [Rhodospirillaceae bacterium]|nr:hypothetical protein [Rhodospirillaceae bacterium]